METQLSFSKSEYRALKELVEAEDEIFNTQGPSAPAEPDLIDLLDLENLLNSDTHLKPDLSSRTNLRHSLLPQLIGMPVSL